MKFKPFVNLFFYSFFVMSSFFVIPVNANVETKNVAKLVDIIENRYERLHTELVLAENETGDQRLISQLKVIALLKYQQTSMGQILQIYDRDKVAISKAQLLIITNGIEQFLKEEQNAYKLILEQVKKERRSTSTISGNDLIMKEVEIANKQESLDIILQHMHYMRLTLNKFQANSKHLDDDLIKTAKHRAIESSLILSYVANEHQELSSKMLSASSFEKESLEIELRRLSIKKESSTKTLKVVIHILDSYQLNVDDFRTVLISNVGAEGDDIFEITVITRVLDNWLNIFLNWLSHNALDYAINLFIFFLILGTFYIFSNFAKKMVTKATLNSKLNFSRLLRQFMIVTTGRIVLFVGFLVAFSYLGIELAPLLTGFGVAGIVIGFALQGTLSNFASGVMMLIYRPFDVGDMIIAGGEQGTVEKLSLVNTTIHTIDNRRVVLPNNLIWEGTITNISAEHLRRVDLIFGIGYADDLLLAEKVMMDEMCKHPKVLKTPEPIVKVAELGDSSVNFWVRPWVENEDYWDVHWDLTKAIKLRLDKEGISIPFPQRDVHIYSTEKPLVISKSE